MSDEIRRLSDELARDPSSLVFLQLGEALRRGGQIDLAHKVAVRGLERHPHNADAHDLLARIAVDRGELERAFDEWDMVLRLAPGHVGAKKGMGFICFRQRRLADAERYLAEAAAEDGTDASIASALAHVRRALGQPEPSAAAAAGGDAMGGDAAELPAWLTDAGPAPARAPAPGPAVLEHWSLADADRDPRVLFADLIGEHDQTALLLDADGFVLAGAYVTPDGHDVAQEVGAELSGVSDEARRAMRHLDLGDWSSIVVETDVATIALSPAPHDGLLLVAADKVLPLGMVRRLLERAVERAEAWLGRHQ